MGIFYAVAFFFGAMVGSLTTGHQERKVLHEFHKQTKLYMQEKGIQYPPELLETIKKDKKRSQ